MPQPAAGYAGDVTPTEAWELLRDKGARLVDVRTRAEWNFVGVPDLSELGRELIVIEWLGFPSGRPNPDFAKDLEASAGADKGDPVLFLCRSGARSIGAATTATQLGFTEAYNILDGFEGPLDEAGHRRVAGWRVAGLPWRQG